MTFTAELKSLTNAYEHNTEARAAIKDTIAIVERHLFKLLSVPRPKPKKIIIEHSAQVYGAALPAE